MSMELRSYPKVWAIGHPSVAELFDGEVVVQEKVDGSQFAAGVVGGVLYMRSKGAALYPETADKLFQPAVETFCRRHFGGQLREGWVYRGEALCRPKHNTMSYHRAPEGGVILFDIDIGEEARMDPQRMAREACALGLESVPELYRGVVTDATQLRYLLSSQSCLGGPVEGVVAKNYDRFNPRDGKMLMGKLVSEQFKEVNRSDYRKRNPSKGDAIVMLQQKYRTEARWRKAVERLRDEGRLEQDPRDIGALMKEVHRDLEEECAHEIKEDLYQAFAEDVMRKCAAGLAEWYKGVLLESQFSESVEGTANAVGEGGDTDSVTEATDNEKESA